MVLTSLTTGGADDSAVNAAVAKPSFSNFVPNHLLFILSILPSCQIPSTNAPPPARCLRPTPNPPKIKPSQTQSSRSLPQSRRIQNRRWGRRAASRPWFPACFDRGANVPWRGARPSIQMLAAPGFMGGRDLQRVHRPGPPRQHLPHYRAIPALAGPEDAAADRGYAPPPHPQVGAFCGVHAVLGILLWRFVFYSPALANWQSRAFAAALLLAALYTSTDEFHQKFVPGRTPLVTDVLLDTSGAAAGLVVLWATRRLRPKT